MSGHYARRDDSGLPVRISEWGSGRPKGVGGHAIPAQMPESMADAQCKTAEGLVLIDLVIDSPENQKNRERMVALCHECPAIRDCLTWVTKAERPAGAWYGIFAGLTPTQRARYAGTHPSRRPESAREQETS